MGFRYPVEFVLTRHQNPSNGDNPDIVVTETPDSVLTGGRCGFGGREFG